MRLLHQTWREAKGKVRSNERDWAGRNGMNADLGGEFDKLETEVEAITRALRDLEPRARRLSELTARITDLEAAYGMGMTTAVSRGMIQPRDRTDLVNVLNAINRQIGQVLNQGRVDGEAIAQTLKATSNKLGAPIS